MRMKRTIKRLLMMSILVIALCGSALTVFAEETSSSSTTQSASTEERNKVRGQLNRYYTDLKACHT